MVAFPKAEHYLNELIYCKWAVKPQNLYFYFNSRYDEYKLWFCLKIAQEVARILSLKMRIKVSQLNYSMALHKFALQWRPDFEYS